MVVQSGPITFCTLVSYFFGSFWGSYHCNIPHEDGQILAYSARGMLRANWLVFSLMRRGPSARWVGVPKVWGGTKVGVGLQKNAPEPPPCIIAVWLVALRLGGMVFQRLHQNPHHIWGCARSGCLPCGSMGLCSKQLHQNPHPVYYFPIATVFKGKAQCSFGHFRSSATFSKC